MEVNTSGKWKVVRIPSIMGPEPDFWVVSEEDTDLHICACKFEEVAQLICDDHEMGNFFREAHQAAARYDLGLDKGGPLADVKNRLGIISDEDGEND